MNLPQVTDGLNDKQYQSVTLKERQNALILAGAGSGKTRVLIHRIAYLLTEKNIQLDNILAVTFTNKAANEIRERLSALLTRPIANMWLGTFHSLAHRLLRTHYKQAGLSAQFQILDAQDQLRIIKRLLRESNTDDAQFPARKVAWFINNNKDEGVKPADIDVGHNYFTKQSVVIFERYEEYCKANDLVDFAELLQRSYAILKDNAELLKYYQQRFECILVDEFQDTNTVQYQWIKLLFSGTNTVFCVGDDDQSIYGWRGAKSDNMQQLKVDFQPLTTIKLEQNYRSTATILAASNALITHNKNRLEKVLWTQTGAGDLIDLYKARSETDEAYFVVKRIKKHLDNGVNPDDCAVLYRANALSRNLEAALIKYNIPYVIYGGLRFFERAEIKDAICYLRLIENTRDNVAFERIVNFPTRGIGSTTLERLTHFANDHQQDLFQAAKTITTAALSTRALNALTVFVQLIEKIKDHTKHFNLEEKIAYLIKESGLLAHYSSDKTDKTLSKKDNLEELINAAKQHKLDDDSELSETMSFIALASLDLGATQQQQSVQLMSVHSAKGLEFHYVFLIGLEENLFPAIQNLDEPHLLDEERRLCYVGMTRARTKLSLSFASKRFWHGQSIYPHPSRFLQEIPIKYINILQQKQSATRQNSFADKTHSPAIISTAAKPIPLGTVVKHSKFGIGTVLNFEGSGESARVEVRFGQAGTKWLICAYANLQY